jgi:hypothetical protein
MGYAGFKKTQGRDFNFFQKVDVNWSTFGGGASDGYGPDLIITFTTQGLIFLNEGSGVVEYSFNGTTVHGELDSAGSTKMLTFNSRVASLIWFRVKSGSSGPIKVSVQAWGS